MYFVENVVAVSVEMYTVGDLMETRVHICRRPDPTCVQRKNDLDPGGPRSFASRLSFRLVTCRELANQCEQRQVHRDNNGANGDAEETD